MPTVLPLLHFFPIQHADLTRLDLPNETFDAVLTGDVLEYVPSLSASLREMARVIRPGGVLLSTFRFAVHSAETIIAARLEGDKIIYLRPPSYHGDPLDPKGVLVFQIPGWDILEMCRSVGLDDARMVMHASSEHGVLADDTIGVLVLSAIKSKGGAKRPHRDWIWDADRINRVVGVLGLPRSGTTMFAAVLDAHDNVTSIYEPWNASKKARADGTKTITAASLVAEAEAQNRTARTMVIKETTANFAYAKYLAQILDQILPPISRHMLILLRNPFHCFLSEIEGRRKWWGEESLQVSQGVFTDWAQRTLASLAQLIEISETYKGTFVFYEACVSEPGSTFSAVMRDVGLDFKPEQLAITKNSDLSTVRGDMSLVENARDVGDLSIAKRESEFDLVHAMFSESPLFAAISGVSDLFAHYLTCGTIDVSDPQREAFVGTLKSLTAKPE